MINRVYIRWLLLLCGTAFCFLPWPVHAWAQQDPLSLGSAEGYFLSGHMSALKDPTGRMDFNEALDVSERGGFTRFSGNLNAGYARAAYWIRFTLVREKGFPKHSMLSLSPSYTNEVTVYIQRPGRHPFVPASYRKTMLGSNVAVSERPVFNPNFVVPLDLPAGMPVDVYVRVSSTGSVSLTGRVSTLEDLRTNTYWSIMLQFGYLGIALVVAVMNLIFFISIRDRLFLYFSFYALIVLLNNIGVSGMVTLLYPSYAHVLSDYLVYMGIGAQMLVFAEFAHSLFRDTGGVWSLRSMRMMSFMGILTMASVPLGLYAYIVPFGFIGIIALISMLLWMSKQILVSMPQSGIFITIAFAISTLGYFYQILRLLGVLPLVAGWDINMIEPATLVHMVLISIALSERFRIAERQLADASRLAEKRAVEMAADMTSELRENKERLEVSLAAEHLAAERQHRFLTMLSHEYRTPLAIIQGNLDILSINSEDGEETEAPELTKMRRAVSRLVDVMDGSLEQSRLMDPQVAGSFKTIAAKEFVALQIEAVRWMWPDRSFIVNDALSDECISGELPLLNTALFNVLDNAQKYSPKDSPVMVSSNCIGGYIVLCIMNRSEGLEKGEPDILFDKYRRGASSKSTAGAGVGLWLVRQIIEQHDGDVAFHVSSEGMVTLTLRFPVVTPVQGC